MESSQDPLLVHIVISRWHETPCRAESGSLPRICLTHTVHSQEIEAIARAESEAEFCLLPSQTISGRRCALLRVQVPSRLLGVDGSTLSWVSDRISELARRAGLLAPVDIPFLIASAFEAMEAGIRHALPMLQASSATAALGMPSLPVLLKTMAGMPAEAALTLKGNIEALLLSLPSTDIPTMTSDISG